MGLRHYFKLIYVFFFKIQQRISLCALTWYLGANMLFYTDLPLTILAL